MVLGVRIWLEVADGFAIGKRPRWSVFSSDLVAMGFADICVVKAALIATSVNQTPC